MRCITITQRTESTGRKEISNAPYCKMCTNTIGKPLFPKPSFVTTIGRLGYLGCNFLSHTLLFTLIKSFFPDKFGTDETPPTRDLSLPELVKKLDLVMED